MPLVCPEENSCIVTAINFYFNKVVFKSLADMREQQHKIMSAVQRQKLHEYDIRLIQELHVNEHRYKKETLFDSGSLMRKKWPIKIHPLRNKVIVDYYVRPGEGGGQGEMHVEAAEFVDGEYKFLRGDYVVLPYRRETLEEYVQKALEPETDLRMIIFRYKQNNE
jgi:hypothetical protein